MPWSFRPSRRWAFPTRNNASSSHRRWYADTIKSAVADDAVTRLSQVAPDATDLVFIGIFIGFMALWALINLTTRAWDPYPFILLNLFLSMLAGLQGAILLIAAKRQDAISAALAQHDFDTNLAAKKEIEELMAINKRQLEMLEDLRQILAETGVQQIEGAEDARGTAAG